MLFNLRDEIIHAECCTGWVLNLKKLSLEMRYRFLAVWVINHWNHLVRGAVDSLLLYAFL